MDWGTITHREEDQPRYPRLNIGLDERMTYVYSSLLCLDFFNEKQLIRDK